jgi:hypothetical protein
MIRRGSWSVIRRIIALKSRATSAPAWQIGDDRISAGSQGSTQLTSTPASSSATAAAMSAADSTGPNAITAVSGPKYVPRAPTVRPGCASQAQTRGCTSAASAAAGAPVSAATQVSCLRVVASRSS